MSLQLSVRPKSPTEPCTLALGAYIEGNEVGEIGCKWNRHQTFIETFSVDPKWQNHGIGKKLLQSLEKILKEKETVIVTIDYPDNLPAKKPLEHLLQELGWAPPSPVSYDYYFLSEQFSPPWLYLEPKLPEGVEIIPWTHVTEEQKGAIRHQIEQKRIPKDVSPFTKPLVEKTSLALRLGDQIIGWMVNTLPKPDLHCYKALYVHKERRFKGLGIVLLAASIRIQKTYPEFVWALFKLTPSQNPPSWNLFVQKKLAPLAQEKVTLLHSWHKCC